MSVLVVLLLYSIQVGLSGSLTRGTDINRHVCPIAEQCSNATREHCLLSSAVKFSIGNRGDAITLKEPTLFL